MAARVLPALALSSRHKALRRDGFPLHRGQRFLLWPQLVPSDKLSVPLAAAGWLGPRSVDVTAGESRIFSRFCCSFRDGSLHTDCTSERFLAQSVCGRRLPILKCLRPPSRASHVPPASSPLARWTCYVALRMARLAPVQLEVKDSAQRWRPRWWLSYLYPTGQVVGWLEALDLNHYIRSDSE